MVRGQGSRVKSQKTEERSQETGAGIGGMRFHAAIRYRYSGLLPRLGCAEDFPELTVLYILTYKKIVLSRNYP